MCPDCWQTRGSEKPCGVEGHETPGVILKYEQVTWNLPEGVLGVSPAGPLHGQDTSRDELVKLGGRSAWP